MSAASAITFLWVHSVRNWVRAQLRRLKNPRYLVAAAAGAFYFYLLIFRRMELGPSSSEPPGPTGATLIEAALTGAAAVAVLSTWIFGGSRGVLQFTEAEVQHLFTAPLSRRAILQIRVLKTLLRTGLSALIMTVLFRRAWGASAVPLALGSWMSFSMLSLHGAGVSLVRESLWKHGRFGWRRWALALAVAVAAVSAVAFWALAAHRPPPPEAFTADAMAAWAAWLRELMSSAPLSYVLWPLRAPIRVALAQDFGELVRRLPLALAVLGALYAWVISSSVAFEEAAVEAASERAKRVEARQRARAGIRLPTKVKSSRLPLPWRGPAWLALTWKNLIAARRLAGPALLLALIGIGLSFALFALRGSRSAGGGEQEVVPLLVAAGAASLAGFLAFFGPVMVTADLRQDMPMSDVLRTLPLRGWQVVLGEVLASALLLALAQWALWTIALISAWSEALPGLEGGQRLAVAAAAMAFGPALSFAGLCVQNAGAIFFPAWVTNEGRLEGRGFEATGQRLLTLVGTLLVLLLALLPSSLVGAAAGALVSWLTGGWALAAVAGAVVASGALVAESLLAVWLLGTVFERIDLTQ